MALSSCLYRCRMMHQRLWPRRHGLHHGLFMLYLDLDELEVLAGRLRLFSHGRWNLYGFFDADHLFGSGTPGAPLKQRLGEFLASQGIALPATGRIRLLTLPRIAGYVFNPISVYFCFADAAAAAPLCAIAEVGNTFGEQKLYLLRAAHPEDAQLFRARTPKHFYVSPFSSLSLDFDFRLRTPGERLALRIDDFDGERRVLRSGLWGERRTLSDARLAGYALLYPLLTLQVIARIHWHALRLWLKGIPWYRKADSPHLQQQVLRPKRAAPR
jgi:DUF1365 family protein